MAKQRLTRQSLKDQIVEILIDRIIKGILSPGDRVKELQIADEFGTSQAPVREAIKCLEALGYIEHVPHVGAMVKTYNRKELVEAYQIREALEVHALSLVGNRVAHLATSLENQLKEMEIAVKSSNIRHFIESDNLFHRLIVDFSNNDTMLSVWDSLKMQLQVIATVVETAMPLETIYALHPPIVATLKNERVADTKQKLHGHYRAVRHYWEKMQS